MIVTSVDSNDGEVAIPQNVRTTGNHLRSGFVGHMSVLASTLLCLCPRLPTFFLRVQCLALEQSLLARSPLFRLFILFPSHGTRAA